MYVGGPRRGRLIHWLNLPGDSPDRLFCFLRGMKKFYIAGKGTGFFCAFFVMPIFLFRFFKDYYCKCQNLTYSFAIMVLTDLGELLKRTETLSGDNSGNP